MATRWATPLDFTKQFIEGNIRIPSAQLLYTQRLQLLGVSILADVEELGVGGLQHCIKAKHRKAQEVRAIYIVKDLHHPQHAPGMQVSTYANNWDIIPHNVFARKASADMP